MFYTGISNNKIIVINRGDTFCSPLFINIGTLAKPKKYILTQGDIVYFSICEPNQDFENGVIRKMFTRKDQDKNSGEIELKLVPSDTMNILPGMYYYEIKLRICGGIKHNNNDIIYTIVPKRKLIIC